MSQGVRSTAIALALAQKRGTVTTVSLAKVAGIDYHAAWRVLTQLAEIGALVYDGREVCPGRGGSSPRRYRLP